MWSLVEKSVAYIKYPKPLRHRHRSHFSASPSPSAAGAGAIHAFSPDGRYLALAERRSCRDFISLFDVTQWVLVRVCDSPPLPHEFELLKIYLLFFNILI